MVASRHKKVLGQAHLPCQKSKHAFYWKATSIYEVSIKQIRVLLRGYLIDLEDVQKVIVLPMNIAAHCNLLQVLDCDVDQVIIFLKDFSCFLYYHYCVLPVNVFLLLLPFHHSHNPFRGYIIDRIQSRSSIWFFNEDIIDIDRNLFIIVVTQRLG